MRATPTMALTAISLLLLPWPDALGRPRRSHQTPPRTAPVRQEPQPQPSPPAQQAPGNDESQSSPTRAPATPAAPPQNNASGGNDGVRLYSSGGPGIAQTPVSNLFPGKMSLAGNVRNPVEGDPEAIQRGMSYFDLFNCSGCHAPNGGGGMGPALSNRFFIYGDDPANIYLRFIRGAPNGMRHGARCCENIIWDITAYIQSISKSPTTGWGKTASRDAWTVQQIPAEFSSRRVPGAIPNASASVKVQAGGGDASAAARSCPSSHRFQQPCRTSR